MATLLPTGIKKKPLFKFKNLTSCFLPTTPTLTCTVCPRSRGGGGELTRVQALHDGGGVDQVAIAQWTCEVRVEIRDFNPVGLHFIHVGQMF